QLLSEVYLELLGGRQHGLLESQAAKTLQAAVQAVKKIFREARPHAANAEELAAHAEMVKKLKNPLWAEQKG
ncbi:MAG: DNA polymerase III subunit epsilon, partial [Alphaproteobacteria bacterium]|nr:DNA polymerase III subunit epsilon [Alphaproteobacteria bacterium]